MRKFFEDHPRTFAFVFVALAVAFIAAIVTFMPSPVVTLEQEVTRTANGQPLDAIAHPAPAFAGGDVCWRVHDRQTGESWWLVEMPAAGKVGPASQWVVLPRLGGGAPDAQVP